MGGRWCYLATWRDACSRRVVGWYLAAQMPTELVLLALEQALTLRQPAPGLIIHADRGSQHSSAACRVRIAQAGGLLSFSRPGNPHDNALPGTTQAESFWSRLKTEELERREWPVLADLADAQASVADYFDCYNHERLHSRIDYQFPYRIH